MKKKHVIIIICLFLVVELFISAFFDKEVDLIDEINFVSDPTKNISELYMSQKYEPDLYMCLGKTVSDEIYVGYIQVKKFGIINNGSESYYFSLNSLYNKSYYCLKKTQEEGQFYFGFIEDESIQSVNVDEKNIKVNLYNYPNDDRKFGFWCLKTDYNYVIQQLSFNKTDLEQNTFGGS